MLAVDVVECQEGQNRRIRRGVPGPDRCFRSRADRPAGLPEVLNMPTYEYRCADCERHFDIVQAFTDDALTECPECGGRLKKVFASVGIAFKGSGFYVNDSGSKKSTTHAAAASSETSSAASSDSGSSTANGSDAGSTSSDSTKSGEKSKKKATSSAD